MAFYKQSTSKDIAVRCRDNDMVRGPNESISHSFLYVEW